MKNLNLTCQNSKLAFFKTSFTLLLCIFLGAMNLNATVYRVSPNGSDSNTGLSWPQAFETLQHAINTANAGDEIWVKQGTYKPTLPVTSDDREKTFSIEKDVAIYGGFAGSESSRMQRNWQSNTTTLSGDLGAGGNADNAYHVIYMKNLSSTMVLDGFTIQDGNADVPQGESMGGGILMDGDGPGINTSPSISNCSFLFNHAIWGGAVAHHVSEGNVSPNYANCQFSNNAAQSGGAVYSRVFDNGFSFPVYSNCDFDGNTAVTGGAVRVGTAFGSMNSDQYTNCNFTNNGDTNTSTGGAFLSGVGGSGSTSTSQFSKCLFSGNQGISAGAVRTGAGGFGVNNVSFDNSVFLGNYSEQLGSAVRNGTQESGESEVTFRHCTFAGNAADFTPGTVITTVSDNGGPCINRIQNSIMWGNDVNILNAGGTTQVIQSTMEGGYPNGTNIFEEDPLFEDEPDFNNAPSTVGNLQLDDCSPVQAKGAPVYGLPDDFLNNPRGPAYDLGAYELQVYTGINCRRDADEDGYGDPSTVKTFYCYTCGPGYVQNDDDCDDTNENVNPDATEICNGIDDDCDGHVDESGGSTTWYFDADGDGYGRSYNTSTSCTQPPFYVELSGDCDDLNELVFPGATEVCNGQDDDCDGDVDEGFATQTWYRDIDGDGYGNPNIIAEVCYQPFGYVSNDEDCDDADSNINPAATEICNGIDDDCDGLIDNGIGQAWYADTDSDGYGDANNNTMNCNQPSGYVSNNEDCDDTNANVNPGTTEVCNNGIDDNCDGNVDEGCTPACTVTISDIIVTHETCPGAGDGSIEIIASTDGSGQLGYSIDGGTSFVYFTTFSNVVPGTYSIVVQLFGGGNCSETGSASVEEAPPGSQQTWYKDMDSDGFTDGLTILSCVQPTGFVLSALPDDCNDNDPNQFPGQTWYKDLDNDGYSDGTTQTACAQPTGYKALAQLAGPENDCNDTDSAVHPYATEICNGIDDDCDGEIDEGTSGGLTWTGNVVFYTQADVDAWSSCYSIIDGNMTVSGSSIIDLMPLTNLEEVTGAVTIQFTGLVDMLGLENLTDIGGILTIFFNSSLTSLNGLEGLESVGSSLMMYYNFLLSDCCAFFDLLSNGGVSGSIVIYLNMSGCNSQSEILSTCAPSSNMMTAKTGTIPSISNSTKQSMPLLGMDVFPNPTADVWNVRLNKNENEKTMIRLFDTQGRELWIKALELAESQIEVDPQALGLAAGMYFLQMTASNGETAMQRVVFDGRF